ncbi:uncharacterized protein VTP21DRAFT_1537 [Calcarisporiella thermophila]|uniref:uncharacterized protein n=1 Tax=Calcarisporiella thermophila TaxID=911321 RepID=UPI00374412D0
MTTMEERSHHNEDHAHQAAQTLSPTKQDPPISSIAKRPSEHFDPPSTAPLSPMGLLASAAAASAFLPATTAPSTASSSSSSATAPVSATSSVMGGNLLTPLSPAVPNNNMREPVRSYAPTNITPRPPTPPHLHSHQANGYVPLAPAHYPHHSASDSQRPALAPLIQQDHPSHQVPHSAIPSHYTSMSPLTPVGSAGAGTFTTLRLQKSPAPPRSTASTPDKPYSCDRCELTFTRQHNLKSHYLTHTEERPFECPECKQQFRRHHDLKRHQKLHTGERPYVCPTCNRSFARLDALNRHMRTEGRSACNAAQKSQRLQPHHQETQRKHQPPSKHQDSSNSQTSAMANASSSSSASSSPPLSTTTALRSGEQNWNYGAPLMASPSTHSHQPHSHQPHQDHDGYSPVPNSASGVKAESIPSANSPLFAIRPTQSPTTAVQPHHPPMQNIGLNRLGVSPTTANAMSPTSATSASAAGAQTLVSKDGKPVVAPLIIPHHTQKQIGPPTEVSPSSTAACYPPSGLPPPGASASTPVAAASTVGGLLNHQHHRHHSYPNHHHPPTSDNQSECLDLPPLKSLPELEARNRELEERVRALEAEVEEERRHRARLRLLEEEVRKLEVEKSLLKSLLVERGQDRSSGRLKGRERSAEKERERDKGRESRDRESRRGKVERSSPTTPASTSSHSSPSFSSPSPSASSPHSHASGSAKESPTSRPDHRKRLASEAKPALVKKEKDREASLSLDSSPEESIRKRKRGEEILGDKEEKLQRGERKVGKRVAI